MHASNMSDFVDNFIREESYSEEEDCMFESKTYSKNYHTLKIDSEDDSAAQSDSDNEYLRQKSETEMLREKNIKRNQEFLKMLMNDPEYAEVLTTANELKKTRTRKVVRTSSDPCFRYSGHVAKPLAQRRSFRLLNIPPIIFKEDLIDDAEKCLSRKRKRSGTYDYYDLETIKYQPKQLRTSVNAVPARIIPVEEVTDQMIANIARKFSIKTYSDAGTSCHQCRQKTLDQKSNCRSGTCTGIRGQFCGVCLENRYGEDVAVALKDPQWKCPVCRGICNCSFCRHKAGKRPTGILAPLAQQAGHKSVKDFLESLKGEGDFVQQDSLWQKMKDSKYLLGFSRDLKYAQMGGEVVQELKYFLVYEKFNMYIWREQNQLNSLIDVHNQTRNLLGFSEGTDKAILDDETCIYMSPVYCKWKFDEHLQRLVEESERKKT